MTAPGTRTHANGLLLTLSANIAIAALGFATGTAAARLLGPSGRGQLAAIQIWPTFLASIAMIGMPEALVYSAAREPERSGRQLASGMLVALMSGILFMAVGYVLIPILLQAQPVATVAAARWYLWLIPISVSVGLPYHPLRGRAQFGLWNCMRMAPGLGWLAILAIAASLHRSDPTFLARTYLWFMLFLTIPVLLVAKGSIPGPYWPDLKTAFTMVRYGLPCMFSSISQMFNLRLDQMIMAGLLPARDLGLYVAAVAWSNMVLPITNALGSVLCPRVASACETSHRSLVFREGIGLAVCTCCGAAIFISINTRWAFPWVFGSGFSQAIPATYVLIAAAAVCGFNVVLEEGLRGLGRPDAVFRAELVGVAATVILLASLLKPFGILGAAIASLGAYSIVGLVLTIQAAQAVECSSWRLLRPNGRELYMNYCRAMSYLTTVAGSQE